MKVCSAIKEKRLMSFMYNGHLRIVIPATHGALGSVGIEGFRGYQIGGTRDAGTIPNWGLFHISKMQNFQILEEGFTELPPLYKREDRGFSKIHCQLT